MNVFSRILGSIEARIVPPRFRFFRSLYANFRLLPFRQAIKMPIYIYGRVHLYMLNGSLEFRNCEIKRGMVKFGTLDPFNLPDGSGFISLAPKSKLICHGPVRFDVNSKLRILGDGQIILGKYVRIRSGVKLICNNSYIKIGDYTGVAFESTVINSSFHTVYNVNTRIADKQFKPIIIGKACWIGNRSSIAGGTTLKDHSIVCAGSYVNKDFSVTTEEDQMLGGRPAKLIKCGIRRIFNPQIEFKLIEYFDRNETASCFKIPDDIEDVEDDETIDF